jgi:hypothetical protein
LDQLKRIWEAFIDFLTTYDSYKVTEMLHDLKWEEVTSNPYVWLIGLPSVGYMLVKRRFKTVILLASLGSFLYLLEITLPSSGEAVPFEKLLTFIGGTVVLVVVNLYFIFMRGD